MARRLKAFSYVSVGLLAAGLSFLGSGCVSQPAPRPVDLEFLQATGITRADVDEHMGAPNAEFESDRVVAYRLTRTDQGYFVMPQRGAQTDIQWKPITYDLVLAFDEAGVVSEHRLIAIHEPPAEH